jgi:tRNA threonylcarbamoyladenosine biosynthesis protein TsaE
MKYLSSSLAETNKIALDFIKYLESQKFDKALVIGLFGDLGSGKTTFTQALGQHLKIKEVMTSPTFVIEKKYQINSTSYKLQAKKLIHIDAYRLESGKELLSLDFMEMQNDPKNLILIEWPERVWEILPADLIKVNFKFISDTEREIVL